MPDRVDRLLKIKAVLGQRVANSSQLGQLLGVCSRTIYRDLEYLRQLGARVEFDQEQGGYRWESGGLSLALGEAERGLLREAASLLAESHPELAVRLLRLSAG